MVTSEGELGGLNHHWDCLEGKHPGLLFSETGSQCVVQADLELTL